jgi:rhodanese-related sulfurtransferase
MSSNPAPTAESGFLTLTPEEVAERIAANDELFLLDVREPRAYHAGHIADATLLPAGDFADRYMREIDPEDTVILVCERGQTSEAAAKFLVNQGFHDVATMAGGMLAWTGPLVVTR